MARPRPILGVHAPAPRPTLAAVTLAATGLAAAFLVILTGFTLTAMLF